MSIITTSLHNTEASKNSVGVVQREQTYPAIPEPVYPADHVRTENAAGSRWVVGSQTAKYICGCGNSTEFGLSVFGPKPVANCCIHALKFPL